MVPAFDYEEIGDLVCMRCGLQSEGPHATAEDCIDALRDALARLEFEAERHAVRQHARNGADGRGGFRKRRDARMVVLDGQRLCLTEAARRLGMSASALHFRIVRRSGTTDYSDVDLRAIQVEVKRTPNRSLLEASA